MELAYSSAFKEEKKCQFLAECCLKFSLFVNENVFWRKCRNLHSAVTYNHYTIVVTYFTLQMLLLTLLKDSALFMSIVTALLIVELVLFRPYGKVL